MAYPSSCLRYIEIMVANDDPQTYNMIDSDDDDGGNRSVRAGIGSQEQANPNTVIPNSPPEECSVGLHDIISPKSDGSWGHRSVSIPQQGLGSLRARGVNESSYLRRSDSEVQDVVPPSYSLAITKTQPWRMESMIDQSKFVPFAIRSVLSDSSKVNPQHSKLQVESVIVKVRAMAMTEVMP